jgi:hypothetical protein
MTATIVETTVVETTETDDDFDIVHLVCHCTDLNISYCGMDVSSFAYCDDSDEVVECAMCNLASEMSEPACPWGCKCTEEMNEYSCNAFA